MEPIVELRNLSKTFGSGEGQVAALQHVSVAVQPGEIFGIIGLSGAGKSTLVRCINLLERPDEGQVLFHGKDLMTMKNKELRMVRRKISMIYQSFNLLDQRSSLDNICFPLELSGTPKAEAENLKKELEEALAQRPVISAAIAEAREKGDLSENAEYDAAREAQGLLEVKIANLKNRVANAKVINESQIGTDKVQMMNKVKVMNLTMNREMEFTIVGESEADLSKGRLALTTPIAKALLGHAKGDLVEAKVPAGIIKFKILDITI